MDKLDEIRTWLAGCDSTSARVGEHLSEALESVFANPTSTPDMGSQSFVTQSIQVGINSAIEVMNR